MGSVVELIDDVVSRCQSSLGEHGRLYTGIPGFTPRPQQIQLAAEIAQAIDQKTILVAEAGTGTGKTFAYLVPCLLSGKKTVISTATKTLQDQLFHKDLPMLIRALGLSSRVQNLKGRANYLCRYRIELHAEQARFASEQCVEETLYVREKLPQLTAGERSELPEIKEDSPVWPYVTSTVDNCLGNECAYQQTCFLVKARKRALEADVVVINHHLYFADSRLKQEGFGELLPGVDAVVFDEAHQLAEIASNFYGDRVSTRQFRELMDDVLHEWPVLDLANQPLKQYSIQLDRVIDALLTALPDREERFNWSEVIHQTHFIQARDNLMTLIEAWLACFDEASVENHSGLKRCHSRLEALQSLMQIFTQSNQQKIFWVERFKRTLVFQATPIEISSSFLALLKRQSSAYIFTSATLTMASSFACFTKPLGIETEAKTLALPSPFDFETQALLYLPRSMPDPKNNAYYEALLERVIPVIQACGGRCFFLFTSHRALKLMAGMLADHLSFPLLVQGEEAKPILLERFRQLGNAVLLGTATFWEGVDVKGDALSCVIIDKLPFASPADPVIRGKMAYFKSQGLSGFEQLSLPNAILALKQGVGRLIRDSEDKGVLMIADPRLVAKAYSRQIFESLPKMPKTRDEKTVLTFIDTLFGSAHLKKETEPL